MAKYGEGDSRWIVEERKDGTNVNNWHWAEKDCIGWARSRLCELFKDVRLDGGRGELDDQKVWTTGAVEIVGEAYVNLRKGKIIPGYEFSAKIDWEATAAQLGKPNLKGKIEIPYIADENADEDPEVLVRAPSEEGGDEIRKIIVKEGRKVVWDKIRVLVQEFAKGGPVADSTKSAQARFDSNTDLINHTTAKADVRSTERKKPVDRETRRTLSLKESFFARKDDLYACFTDPGRLKAFTGSDVKIELKVGGDFYWFGGSLTGKFLEINPPDKLKMTWRFGQWPQGIESEVLLLFEEKDAGNTIVCLKQEGIPEEDEYGNEDLYEQALRGWKENVFHRIRLVFGYGV